MKRSSVYVGLSRLLSSLISQNLFDSLVVLERRGKVKDESSKRSDSENWEKVSIEVINTACDNVGVFSDGGNNRSIHHLWCFNWALESGAGN